MASDTFDIEIPNTQVEVQQSGTQTSVPSQSTSMDSIGLPQPMIPQTSFSGFSQTEQSSWNPNVYDSSLPYGFQLQNVQPNLLTDTSEQICSQQLQPQSLVSQSVAASYSSQSFSSPAISIPQSTLLTDRNGLTYQVSLLPQSRYEQPNITANSHGRSLGPHSSVMPVNLSHKSSPNPTMSLPTSSRSFAQTKQQVKGVQASLNKSTYSSQSTKGTNNAPPKLVRGTSGLTSDLQTTNLKWQSNPMAGPLPPLGFSQIPPRGNLKMSPSCSAAPNTPPFKTPKNSKTINLKPLPILQPPKQREAVKKQAAVKNVHHDEVEILKIVATKPQLSTYSGASSVLSKTSATAKKSSSQIRYRFPNNRIFSWQLPQFYVVV